MKHIKTLLIYTVGPVFFLIAIILYFSSKILRAISYLLLLKLGSAKSEMIDFWKIKYNASDLF